MKKFEAKKQIKNRVYSRTTVVVLLVMIVLLSRGVFTLYLRYKESDEVKLDAERRLGDLLQRKEVLQKEIQGIDREGGIETEIRQKFNVARPGEKVVIIVPEIIASSTSEREGFFGRLWHKISD